MLFHWHKRAVLFLESVMLKGLLHCQTTVYNRGISWSVKLFWAKLRVNQVCRLYCSSQYKLLLPVWDHFKLSPVGCLGTLHLSQGKNWYVFCHALHFQRNHLVTKHYDMSCRRLFGGFLTFFFIFFTCNHNCFPSLGTTASGLWSLCVWGKVQEGVIVHCWIGCPLITRGVCVCVVDGSQGYWLF